MEKIAKTKPILMQFGCGHSRVLHANIMWPSTSTVRCSAVQRNDNRNM